jgi:hypothetical protein
MEDGPRYRLVNVAPNYLEHDLQRSLRPGDRIVSVVPTRSQPGRFSDSFHLVAIIELRHPSWAAEGVGWVSGHVDEEHPL